MPEILSCGKKNCCLGYKELHRILVQRERFMNGRNVLVTEWLIKTNGMLLYL